MTDAYNKCRKCANFGTENCPESSLCFALNYKPFYKAKAKSKMKKKHRRAVYDATTWIIIPIYCIFYYPATWIWKFTNWLKTKLRVYDYDPD